VQWQELVVFSTPHKRRTLTERHMSATDCEAIRNLLEYTWPKPEVPMPDEFTDIIAPKIIECVYDEVSPFPDLNRVRIASRILRGGKIFQWTRLSLGEKYSEFRPFSAYRGHDGVVVAFIDPKIPLQKVSVPYCRRICSFISHSGFQCSAFGSYSQIELSPFLPIWPDMCSAESAKNCPMRQAAIKGQFPKPTPEDETVKAFQEWCKTRKGWRREKA